ncbi:hypothetical protein [Geobacter sp.]|nr:hypothetical protein [Geobacter sp.]
MKPIREMTVGEFGAFVASHLREHGIDVVLTGGACVPDSDGFSRVYP